MIAIIKAEKELRMANKDRNGWILQLFRISLSKQPALDILVAKSDALLENMRKAIDFEINLGMRFFESSDWVPNRLEKCQWKTSALPNIQQPIQNTAQRQTLLEALPREQQRQIRRQLPRKFGGFAGSRTRKSRVQMDSQEPQSQSEASQSQHLSSERNWRMEKYRRWEGDFQSGGQASLYIGI
jgi:hypothetical protein